VSLVPEEEMDSGLGMGLLSETEEFKSWNLGVALDEGLAREDDDMVVFYGERHNCWANVR
jgi:aminoacylase